MDFPDLVVLLTNHWAALLAASLMVVPITWLIFKRLYEARLQEVKAKERALEESATRKALPDAGPTASELVSVDKDRRGEEIAFRTHDDIVDDYIPMLMKDLLDESRSAMSLQPISPEEASDHFFTILVERLHEHLLDKPVPRDHRAGLAAAIAPLVHDDHAAASLFVELLARSGFLDLVQNDRFALSVNALRLLGRKR